MAISSRVASAGFAAALLLPVPARAAVPNATAIVTRMHAVLEPERPSVRKLVLRVSAEGGEATEWVAGEARRKFPGGARVVTVVLAPAAVRGTAFLVEEGAQGSVKWLWDPAVRRVRKIVPADGHQAFLGSDFTFYDLGVIDRRATHRLLGEETHDGVRAYEVEALPRSPWYYARILTWIAAGSGFPLERRFYDPAGTLWKVEHFEQVTDVDGVPTVLRLRMEDQIQQGSTVIDVSGVRYGFDVPAALFVPGALPKTVDSPIWQGVGPN